VRSLRSRAEPLLVAMIRAKVSARSERKESDREEEDVGPGRAGGRFPMMETKLAEIGRLPARYPHRVCGSIE